MLRRAPAWPLRLKLADPSPALEEEKKRAEEAPPPSHGAPSLPSLWGAQGPHGGPLHVSQDCILQETGPLGLLVPDARDIGLLEPQLFSEGCVLALPVQQRLPVLTRDNCK